MQQRGFTTTDIDLIINHGVEKISYGASVYTLTRKVTKLLICAGYPRSQLEHCRSSYVVVSDGQLVTVARIK